MLSLFPVMNASYKLFTCCYLKLEIILLNDVDNCGEECVLYAVLFSING